MVRVLDNNVLAAGSPRYELIVRAEPQLHGLLVLQGGILQLAGSMLEQRSERAAVARLGALHQWFL